MKRVLVQLGWSNECCIFLTKVGTVRNSRMLPPKDKIVFVLDPRKVRPTLLLVISWVPYCQHAFRTLLNNIILF